ncbi:MAG: serine hydrolase [Myxococcota bacterium]
MSALLLLFAIPARADSPLQGPVAEALAGCLAGAVTADASVEGTQPARVVARFDREGAVTEVTLEQASGVAPLDDCLVQSLRDQALPPSAEQATVTVTGGPSLSVWEQGKVTVSELDVGEPQPAGTCPVPRGPFPGAAWPDATGSVPPSVVAQLDAHLFPPGLDRDDKERRGVRTDGVAIVHRGELVYERYGPGHGPDTPHLAWSATKSFTNALVGIAVGEGALALDDTVCDALVATSGDACRVHVVDLLEFASGFDWRETYEGESPTTSSVLAMLYGEGRADMAHFVAARPVVHEPGTTWRYSSGDTTLLAAIAGQALAPAHGDRFPWAVLLDPIGMSAATWERDAAGTYVGSSYLWATPRDLARFGELLLEDGCWDGQRILPEGWIAASTAVSGAIRGDEVFGWDPGDVQGRQFWLNRPLPERGQGPKWPSVPEDTFAAQGHWGQSITVVPALDLVVVRTADDRDHSYDHDRTLALAKALVEGR